MKYALDTCSYYWLMDDQTKPETLDGDFQGQQRGPRLHAKADPGAPATLGADTFLKQILADSGSRLAAASFNRGM